MGESLPIAKFDMKGRIICPTCLERIEVPKDRWMSRGIGNCNSRHKFAITDDVCYAVNDIMRKEREGHWRKDNLKEFEETPDVAKPDADGKGRIIL